MKLRITCLLVLAASVSVVPATAQVLYNNGPVNGTVDGWTINFGFAVSDTFTLTSASTVTGVNFYTFALPGDFLENAEVAITSSEFGGTTYSDQVVNFTPSNCSSNQYGYNICLESSSGYSPVNLSAGSYWLTLENAVVNDGDPIFWDENSGVGCTSPGCPSSASENSLGTIPSESFTVFGSASTSTTGTVPEPGSVMLVGSGILAIAGTIRRKLL